MDFLFPQPPTPHPPSELTGYPDLKCESPYPIKATTESAQNADAESISGHSPEGASQISTSYIREEGGPEPREFTIYPDKDSADRDPLLEVEFQRSFTGLFRFPMIQAWSTYASSYLTMPNRISKSTRGWMCYVYDRLGRNWMIRSGWKNG